MSDRTPATPNGPWRYLLLDTSDPDDPKWVLLMVSAAETDVRPAVLGPDGSYRDWSWTARWVRAILGRPHVALTPIPRALAWHVDEQGRPR